MGGCRREYLRAHVRVESPLRGGEAGRRPCRCREGRAAPAVCVCEAYHLEFTVVQMRNRRFCGIVASRYARFFNVNCIYRCSKFALVNYILCGQMSIGIHHFYLTAKYLSAVSPRCFRYQHVIVRRIRNISGSVLLVGFLASKSKNHPHAQLPIGC